MKNEANNSDDIRSRVTKQIIWKAFFDLLSERNFSDVSVQNICTKAQVNRSTFYKYFDSKYDLLDYGITSVIHIEAGLDTAVPSNGSSWETSGPHAALFKYVKEHQKFWNNILSQDGFSSAAFHGMLAGTKMFIEDIYHLPADEIACEIGAQMYIGAIGNLTIWWLKQGCEMPIEELCEYVDTLWRYPKKNSSR